MNFRDFVNHIGDLALNEKISGFERYKCEIASNLVSKDEETVVTSISFDIEFGHTFFVSRTNNKNRYIATVHDLAGKEHVISIDKNMYPHLTLDFYRGEADKFVKRLQEMNPSVVSEIIEQYRKGKDYITFEIVL